MAVVVPPVVVNEHVMDVCQSPDAFIGERVVLLKQKRATGRRRSNRQNNPEFAETTVDSTIHAHTLACDQQEHQGDSSMGGQVSPRENNEPVAGDSITFVSSALLRSSVHDARAVRCASSIGGSPLPPQLSVDLPQPANFPPCTFT